MPPSNNPPLTDRGGYRHWAADQVRWSDTDLVGHANNLVFGAFAETGRCLFLRDFFAPNAAEPAMMLPVQITLNLLGEVHWPAQVQIGTSVLAIGTSSFRLGQGMFEGARCFGSCETVMVLIDDTTRRPRPIPQPMRDWLSSFMIEGGQT
jgi:acyl-CoA thioester hydrolase